MTSITGMGPLADVQGKDCPTWSDWDYLWTAGCAALLIASTPFFWAPPVWVLALMSRPSDWTFARPMLTPSSATTSPAYADAANDNAARVENQGSTDALAA